MVFGEKMLDGRGRLVGTGVLGDWSLCWGMLECQEGRDGIRMCLMDGVVIGWGPGSSTLISWGAGRQWCGHRASVSSRMWCWHGCCAVTAWPWMSWTWCRLCGSGHTSAR